MINQIPFKRLFMIFKADDVLKTNYLKKNMLFLLNGVKNWNN